MSAKAKNKKNKNSTKASRSQVTEVTNKKAVLDYLPSITLVSAAVLIFYPPFFQGLFFPKEMLITHFLTGLVLFLVIVQKWRQRDFDFLRTPLDWAVAAFTLAYLISLIGAVHPGEAWYGFLKVLNYFAVYLIISNVIRNFDDIQTLTRVLVASGVGVAAIGILAALGYSDYPGAFQGGAIYSTLQYSNTTAAFLAVLSLIATGLWTRERGRSLKVIYLLAISIMTLVVLATFSKGAWLIYGVGAVLLIIGMPGVYRFKAIYGLVASSIAAAVTFQKFYPTVTAESTSDVSYLLIGAVVVLAAAFLWEVLEYLFRSKGAVTIALTTILLLIIIAVPLGTFGQEFFSGQNITQELSGLLDFENNSYTSRMDFNRWAWEIVKDYPINGTGAGGWNALYHQYQDYLAWTSEVHNHFMQVWVEAGIIGFLSWIVLLGTLIYCLYRLKNRSHDRMLIWGLAAAGLALVIHSAIDFDFSLPAVFILFWTLIGLLNGVYKSIYTESQHSTQPRYFIEYAVFIILGGTLIITGTMYLSAYQSAQQGARALQQIEMAEEGKQSDLFRTAAEEFEKAVSLDKYNAEYQAEWAHINALQYKTMAGSSVPQSALQAKAEQVRSEIEVADALKPHDLQIKRRLIESAILIGDLRSIINLAEKSVYSNPNDINAYNLYANSLWEGFQFYLARQELDNAKVYASKLIEIERLINDQQAKINTDRPWSSNPLIIPEDVQGKINQAKQFLEK